MPPSPPSPSPSLPALDQVYLSWTVPVGSAPAPSVGRSGSGGWRISPSFRPRSPAQMERDRDVGQRGEALIYRQELNRVRALGFDRPRIMWSGRRRTIPVSTMISARSTPTAVQSGSRSSRRLASTARSTGASPSLSARSARGRAISSGVSTTSPARLLLQTRASAFSPSRWNVRFQADRCLPQ